MPLPYRSTRSDSYHPFVMRTLTSITLDGRQLQLHGVSGVAFWVSLRELISFASVRLMCCLTKFSGEALQDRSIAGDVIRWVYLAQA